MRRERSPMRTSAAPRARSTTMESTTTSLAAVARDPSIIAATAEAGESATVASAIQELAPACVCGMAGVKRSLQRQRGCLLTTACYCSTELTSAPAGRQPRCAARRARTHDAA